MFVFCLFTLNPNTIKYSVLQLICQSEVIRAPNALTMLLFWHVVQLLHVERMTPQGFETWFDGWVSDGDDAVVQRGHCRTCNVDKSILCMNLFEPTVGF